MPLYKKLVYWLPTISWALIIFSFSAQPSLHISQVSWQDFAVKKTAHFCEYFILAALTYYSQTMTTSFSRRKKLIYTFVFISLYALTDEFHQLFTPGRESRIRDVMIDILGGCTAILLIFRIFKKSVIL